MLQNVGTCIQSPTLCIMSGNMKIRAKEPAIEIIRRMGIVRPVDLEIFGITRARLYSLCKKVWLSAAAGIYVARNHALTAEHALAQAAKLVPSGVLCMLTALRFHGLTTQSPAEVWIALQEKARKPRLDYPRLRIVRFSGAALTEGIEAHSVEGVNIRDDSAAKTVVDCFRFRNKIGIDIAVEALRDFSRMHRGGANELARFVRICRVTRVMQPYLHGA